MIKRIKWIKYLLSDPFENLPEDLQATFRVQREWVDKRGLLLVTAHFLSGVGAGAWLIGWLFNYTFGLALAAGVVALSGLVHLVFLGRPDRFWQMVLKPQTSWISRGLWSMSIFIPAAFLYFLPTYFRNLPWSMASSFGKAMLIASLIGMTGIFVYKGFVYTVSRAIPLWNSPLLPLVYIAYGIRGGVALTLVTLPFVNVVIDMGGLKIWWVIASVLVLFLFSLEVGMANHNVAAAKSVHDLIRGPISPIFYGMMIIGFLVPMVLVALSYFTTTLGLATLAAVGWMSLIGDFTYKYCINKVAAYIPLLSGFPVRFLHRMKA